MYVKQKAATWTALDSKDNAVATAQRVGDDRGRCHYVTGVLASYSSAKTGLLQIKDGNTVIAEIYVVNSADIRFSSPLKISPSSSVSAVLDASGTAGVFGKVTLMGYTD